MRSFGTARRSWMIALSAALLAGLVLTACGKKGPPEPPGPPDKVTYPKSYPTR